MNYLKVLNKKLDEGYKLTDQSCPECKYSLVYNFENKQFFCSKCEKAVQLEGVEIQEKKSQIPESENLGTQERDLQISQPQVEVPQKVVDNATSKSKLINDKKQSHNQNEDISQKLADKLVKGWAMLDICCEQCYTPIMRSKQGVQVCVNCSTQQDNLIKQQYTILQQDDQSSKIKMQNTNIKEGKSQQIATLPDMKTAQSQRTENRDIDQRVSGILLNVVKYYDQKINLAIQNDNDQQIQNYLDTMKKIIEMNRQLQQ